MMKAWNGTLFLCGLRSIGIHLLISQCSLSTHYEPGTILGACDTSVNKTKTSFWSLCFSKERHTIHTVNKEPYRKSESDKCSGKKEKSEQEIQSGRLGAWLGHNMALIE